VTKNITEIEDIIIIAVQCWMPAKHRRSPGQCHVTGYTKRCVVGPWFVSSLNIQGAAKKWPNTKNAIAR